MDIGDGQCDAGEVRRHRSATAGGHASHDVVRLCRQTGGYMHVYSIWTLFDVAVVRTDPEEMLLFESMAERVQIKARFN